MKVEILSPPENSFVVGRDLVGYANVGDDPDVWEDLIPDAGSFTASRGGSTSTLNRLDVGLLSLPVKDADPESDFRLRIGRRARLFDEVRDQVLWTGRISDIPASDERDYLVTTLAATDPVDELSNARAAGVGESGTVDTLAQRVARLAAFSTATLAHVTAPFPERLLPSVSPVAWSNPVRALTRTATGAYLQDTVANLDAGGVPLELDLTLTGLNPDGIYRFTVDANFTYGPNAGGVTLWTASDQFVDGYWTEDLMVGPRTLTWTFTAPGPTAGLFVSGAYGGAFPSPSNVARLEVSNPVLTMVDPGPRLQATSVEDSVAAHLTMACDSVGAIWRPMLDGTVQVVERGLDLTPVASFTDDPHDLEADASYTRLQMGYAATDDLVNDLSVTNHGPAADTTHVFTNASSIASYGRRSATLDTCLSTPELLLERAGEVLAETSTPGWSPRELTYVYDDLAIVPDLYEAVTVTRRGVDYACLVLGVRHEVEPYIDNVTRRKHLVTLTLRKVA